MDTQFLKTYHLLKNDILRLAYSYTKNMSDAEDITQEVFVKLYENFSKFNDEEYIKKWCIKVTINKSKNLFFSSWKKRVSYMTEKEENIIAKTPEVSNNMLNAILKLPTKYRILITLYYYNGYKINEISKILNINESTIKTRLKRAKNQLRIILSKEDKDD